MGAGRQILGPQTGVGENFGEIFTDRQAVPDQTIAIDQGRHLARWLMGANIGARRRFAQADVDLVDIISAMAQRDPATQGP